MLVKEFRDFSRKYPFRWCSETWVSQDGERVLSFVALWRRSLLP